MNTPGWYDTRRKDREGMAANWIAYATVEGVAVCWHHAGARQCVCVQFHPPMSAFAPPDTRVYLGDDSNEARETFDSWAEKLRRGELARGTIAAKGDE